MVAYQSSEIPLASCGEKRRRSRTSLKLVTTTACCYYVLSASSAVVVSAFQPYLAPNRRSGSRLSRRQVVTDPTDAQHHYLTDRLLSSAGSSNYYSKRNAEIEKLYRMSADEEQYYPHSEVEWESWLQKTSEQYSDYSSSSPAGEEEEEVKSAITELPQQQPTIQFKGLSTTARKRKGPRRKLTTIPAASNSATSTTKTTKTTPKSKSKTKTAASSRRKRTMPTFGAKSDKQLAHEKGVRMAERSSGRNNRRTVPKGKAAAVARKRSQTNGNAMYVNSASVPDSMVQFANEIHAEERITRQEEVELGEKTQAAIRLQNIYDVLRIQLDRTPSDEEWCAAAGKINMEALRQTIQEGLDAKDKLVTSNLRMVQSVVNTYIRNGLSAQYNAGDLMQEGIMALIRAAEKFEPERGWKFSTYAMYWVRASVKRNHTYQTRVITIPQRMTENYKRLRRVQVELKTELGRMPTKAELGKVVGMSEPQVDRCFTAMAQRCYSLDQELTNHKKPTNVNSRGTLIDLVESSADDGEQERTERHFMVQDLIETLHRHLTPQEVEVLLLRYGLKPSPQEEHRYRNRQLTIAELGTIIGEKPDKVRRMINKSLKQLQSAGLEEWQEFHHALL